MIEATHLRLVAGTRELLSSTSFTVREGEFVAVMGANGVGKTTLLQTLAGVRAPASGHIAVAGRDVTTIPARERAQLIAHIAADESFLERLTTREVVALGRFPHHRWWEWQRTEHDEAAVDDALRVVRASDFASRIFETLSSGERQRVWIALALAQEAPVLLLDEPTSHLDIRAASEILGVLRDLSRKGKTIVCALHDMNEAAHAAHRMLLLGAGRVLAFDTPEKVLTSDAPVVAYGVPLDVTRLKNGRFSVLPRVDYH